MAIAYKNSEQVVAEYSNKWAIACRTLLEVKRPRTSIRAKWKKVGEGWTPISVTKKNIPWKLCGIWAISELYSTRTQRFVIGNNHEQNCRLCAERKEARQRNPIGINA